MGNSRLLQIMSRSLIAIAALVFLTGVQTTLAQSTIFVSSTTGSDAFDGESATISGGSGPKQTLAAAYTAASAGDTISIEAGTYGENFDFGTAGKGVVVEVRQAGAVTVATFTGTSTIAVTTATINLTGGVGSVAVSGGAFTLTSGTISLGAGKLAFTAATTLTVTGGTATGASPTYVGAVTASYTKTAAGSAGTELPANLNAGGTLTVNGGFSTTFPNAVTAPAGITVAGTATGTTTFNGAVAVSGASGVTFAGGFNDVVFNSTLGMGDGAFSTTAGGTTPSVTINGGFTATQDLVNQGGSITNAAGVTVTVATVSVNAVIVGAGNGASDLLGYTVTNNGTMTVTGAISEGSATDANETDSNVIALTNSGTLTVGASSSIAGVFDNTGGTLALGSTTFTLSGPGAHVNMGTITGGGSTVVVSGASAVPASAGVAAPAFDIAGNVNITGNGGVGGALSVAGNLSNSGTGDITAATRVGGNLTLSGAGADISGGSVLVTGNAIFAGTTAVTAGAGTNRVNGSATVSGTLTLTQAAAGGAGLAVSGAVPFTVRVGSLSVSSSGTLTVPAGATLLSDGSLNTSNGGTFTSNPANNSVADDARIAFLLPNNGNATFTPGPNTSVDDLFVHLAAGGAAGTLTLGQSIAIDENFTTDAGTTVSLGNFLIRVNGTTAAATINGNIATPAGQDGALAFEGATTTLGGLGNISNLLVNVGGGNRLSVLAGTSVDFTGALTLFNGGVTVAAGSDISPTGPTAEVRRNAGGAAATDIVGAGTFNGDTRTYILTVFGVGPVTAASEFAATGISTLNVKDTAVYTTDKAATVGNVNVESGASLIQGEAFNITATGAVNNAGVVEGTGGGVNEVLILTGSNQTHTNTGNIGPGLVGFTVSAQASGIVFNGTATLAAAAQSASINNLIVGNGAGAAESITMNNVQQINGTIAVASDGSLTLGLVQDDGVAGTGTGDEGSVDGTISVANGGSMTWTSNAIADAAIAVGTAPIGTAPTFDFNGNVVGTGAAAASFTSVSNAVLGTSGSFDANHAVALSTNLDGVAAPTAALPGLIVDAAATINAPAQSLAVVGTTDINATWGTGGSTLSLTGTVFFGSTFTTTANVTIGGSTATTAEGTHTVAGSLTHNATNVDYSGDAAAANNPDNLVVTGLFTQTAGDVSLSDVDLLFNGGITYAAGAFTADPAPGVARLAASPAAVTGMTGDFVVFGGGAIAVGATPFSVPNLAVTAPLAIAGADAVIVRDFLYNRTGGGITIANAVAPAAAGSLTLGDGTGQMIVHSDGTTITRVGGGTNLGQVNFGSEFATDGHLIYDVAASIPVTLEMPSAFDALTIKAVAGGTQLAAAANVTVDDLTLDGAIDVEGATAAAGESLTVTEGGTVTIGVNGSIVNESYAPQSTTDFTLTYDNLATTTSTATWNAAHQPDVVISPVVAGAGTVFLHANRTATDLSVTAGDTFDPFTFNITVTGTLNLNGNPLAVQSTGAPAGAVVFAGTTAQTLNGGMWYNGGVTLNNAAGLTLTNGNLNLTDNNTNAVCGGTVAGTNPLTLTNGTLTTGTNRVILCHSNTTFQGFSRTNGAVFGSVQATVDGTASPNTTDRVEFPLGDADMNYRPFAITFNTPNNLAADPVLLATYNETNAGGTNGLPISAIDELGNPFEIGRYATEFHWEVTSTPSVTPSIDYDVEYRAAGFANFQTEDIEKTRSLRRQDGNLSNFWIKVANGSTDNDNFAVSATEPVLVARNAVGAINKDGVLFTIGLENNLGSNDVAALTLNAGNTEDVTLATTANDSNVDVFHGGSPAATAPRYTYVVTSGDPAVATGATAGDELTVTGVAAGTTTLTVEATDSFGAVTTTTIAVTVNAAFEAGEALADVTVNDGTADEAVDGSVASTGGTAPVTYAVTTSDATVATAAVDAAGEITLTYVGTGTATITLTATDAEGDTVVTAFDVNVNAALVAADALANLTVIEGADVDVNASAEFSGGTVATDYAFSVASADADVASATNADAAVTVTGVQPYVITGGVVTADTAPVTITVTATDDLGATGTSTFTADVNPVKGNVDGSGGPTEVGASLTLDAFVGLQTLTAKQTIAADFNSSGTVNAFDAALIFDAFVNGKTELVEFPAATIAYGDMGHEGNMISIPVQITGNVGETRALSFSTTIDPAYAKVVGIESTLGDGWIVRSATNEDGSVALAAAGYGSVTSDGTVAILTLELIGDAGSFNLRAEGAVNDNPVANIDELEVVELPETFALNGNYPNPFNASTTISFDLPQAAEVEIEVYDLIGRRVLAVPSQTMQAGAKRSVQVDGNRLASGSYFYRVIAKMDNKTIVETDRMMLVK